MTDRFPIKDAVGVVVDISKKANGATGAGAVERPANIAATATARSATAHTICILAPPPTNVATRESANTGAGRSPVCVLDALPAFTLSRSATRSAAVWYL